MPPQTGPQDAIRARRAEVARLYCRGLPQAQIGRALGVTQQQVSLDLKAIRAEWRRVMVAEFDRIRSEQLGKIDACEAAAWEGWERSLRDAERTLTRKTQDAAGGETIEASRTVAGQAGDPRFLQVVDSCIDRRLRLIGGYAQGDAAPTPAELVVRVYGAGADLRVLHGGRVIGERDSASPN
jgi:predicted transcriptional regulator